MIPSSWVYRAQNVITSLPACQQTDTGAKKASSTRRAAFVADGEAEEQRLPVSDCYYALARDAAKSRRP